MFRNREIGDIGENLAINHLELSGHTILERNWRYRKAEIDIIAREGEALVFVEVKTRSYDHYGRPEEFVKEKQESLIMDAAQRYMEQIGHDWEVRFDIIAIILKKAPQKPEIQHFKDAFF